MLFHNFSDLSARYGVEGIPALIVVKPDGTVITKDGRAEVSVSSTIDFKIIPVFLEQARKSSPLRLEGGALSGVNILITDA